MSLVSLGAVREARSIGSSEHQCHRPADRQHLPLGVEPGGLGGQFGSYLTPLIIMAPIPLTIIGVMPGHALLGAQYTATSMIGMIALAGIIVRNSILLVDFINLQVRAGLDFRTAIVQSAITRAQPIVLTGLAAMLGAFFILDDPIFNGLAISLIFGISVSTVLTLVVIPILYYIAYRHRLDALTRAADGEPQLSPATPSSPQGEPS